MNESARAAIEATFQASNQGSIHFGEVIARLVAAGVEAYHVDYRAGRSVCYLPDDTTLDLAFERPHAPLGGRRMFDVIVSGRLQPPSAG